MLPLADLFLQAGYLLPGLPGGGFLPAAGGALIADALLQALMTLLRLLQPPR